MRDVSDDIIRDGIVTSQSEDMTETAVSPFSVKNYIKIIIQKEKLGYMTMNL